MFLQAEAAWQFLDVMRSYLESLCSDLRFHTITNVQANNDRVSNTNIVLYTLAVTCRKHHKIL